MKITKEKVLEALEVIEKYKLQELNNIDEINRDKRSITILNLGTRELNCLLNRGIETVGDLLALDIRHLRRVRGLGNHGIYLINEAIKTKGVGLGNFLFR